MHLPLDGDRGYSTTLPVDIDAHRLLLSNNTETEIGATDCLRGLVKDVASRLEVVKHGKLLAATRLLKQEDIQGRSIDALEWSDAHMGSHHGVVHREHRSHRTFT